MIFLAYPWSGRPWIGSKNETRIEDEHGLLMRKASSKLVAQNAKSQGKGAVDCKWRQPLGPLLFLLLDLLVFNLLGGQTGKWSIICKPFEGYTTGYQIYIYIYIHIHIYIYDYIYIYICVYMCIYICVYICIYYIYICIFIYRIIYIGLYI